MSPFFSIIVPVYQAEKTITRCIRSVLNQANQDFELILVDDGSFDCSGEICDAFAKGDTRIKVIHQVNSGVSAARNTGIRLSKGEYLLFLDSDDTLAADALSVFSTATETRTADIVIGRMSVIENGIITRCMGTDTHGQFGLEMLDVVCQNPTPFGYVTGKIFRRKIVAEHNITFNQRMYSQEDFDFFLSCCNFCDTFCILSETLYYYFYAQSSRIPPFWDYIANQIKLLKIAKGRSSITAEAETCVRKRILSLLYTGLYCAVEENHYSQTADHISRVEGLNEILSTSPANGEHGFVARNFAAERYSLIRNYFVARNKLRDIFRAIKKR